MSRYFIFLLVLLLPSVVHSVNCDMRTHENNRYTVCTVEPEKEDLRLFLRDKDGNIFGQFSSIQARLPDGKTLVFAMNAGMYHSDRRPVGLYLEGDIQESRLYLNPGPGNFGMVPNGVFCISESRAEVIEGQRFQALEPDCHYATQSGPMLVIDGALHPRFLPDGTSRFIRNGVGTTKAGTVAFFVKSETAVSFHEFGSFFRDVLGTEQALYFDGKVSRLHAPEIGRSDPGFWLGPIVGVVE